MLLNFCLFFSCNVSFITGDLSQEPRRVEGKLFFLPYNRNFLFFPHSSIITFFPSDTSFDTSTGAIE